jgi:hypothetical protein
MGYDADIFLNHNFFEKNIMYTLEKLKDLTGNDVILSGEYFDSEIKNNEDWLVILDDYKTVNDCFIDNGYITIIKNVKTENKIEMWFSKNNFDISGEIFYINGRWNSFVNFITANIEYFMDQNESRFNQYREWFLEREKIIMEYGSLFESTELIMFCGDLNQDILEELWLGKTLENILNENEWEIIKNIPKSNDKKIKYSEKVVYHKKWEKLKYDKINWENTFK